MVTKLEPFPILKFFVPGVVVGAPDRVSRDTGWGLFEPRDTGFVKKISRDTGLSEDAGCGIMPKINTGYGKEPFFWWDTGLSMLRDTKNLLSHNTSFCKFIVRWVASLKCITNFILQSIPPERGICQAIKENKITPHMSFKFMVLLFRATISRTFCLLN